jgi:hypothetical protein
MAAGEQDAAVRRGGAATVLALVVVVALGGLGAFTAPLAEGTPAHAVGVQAPSASPTPFSLVGTPMPATPTAEADECQPEALLESPTGDAPLRGVVPVGGWAVDRNSPSGTGVSEVHVYLDGYGSEPGHTFIGRAEYGGSRTDVAQRFNDVRFARSAFSLSWDASTAGAGAHTLVVLFRTRCGWASLAQPILVDGPTIMLNIEAPPQGASILAPVRLQGWAADPHAPTGTGVDRVDLYLDGQVTTRGIPLGEVPYGESRPDVGAALGGDSESARARFSRSGFSVLWNPVGVTPGQHSLTFYARGPEGAVARSLTVEVTAEAARPPLGTPGAGAPLGPPSGGLGGLPPSRGGEAFGAAVSATTPTSVSLVWVPTLGAASYDIYLSEGVAAFFPAQTGVADTRTTVSGLAPGRSYRLYVRALDASGQEVARSNTVNVTTPSASSGTPLASPSPLRPTPTPGGS